MMAHFLLEKARDKADEVWDAKEYSDESLEKLLIRK
jgi:chemotaxis receptor (MCP) glutamine deamidase CheD